MPAAPQYSLMAPTLVAAAVGALLAAALLGSAYERRSVLVVVGAAVLPSLDAALSLVVHGATNAALHTLLLPAVGAGALYWDTELRTDSRLRERYGWRGVRIAWVALASYLVAGIGLAAVTDGANLLYPFHDRFYAVSGRLALSSQDGLVQTYATLGGDGLLAIASPGTTESYHVASWVNPTPGTGLEFGAERRIALVESGWQVVLVLTAAAVLALRRGEVR